MSAVNSQLVRRSDGLVELFTPPFDHTRHDPGYIKAYPPGLRENGGQYTHAAMWTTLAYAMLGDGDMAGIHRYKVEPYVACADVYTAASHVGRGGWTWYTGSAGWMYRTAIEGILGFHLQGDRLRIEPCIPRTWPSLEITYRYRSARYVITITNPHGVNRGMREAALDDQVLPGPGCEIELRDDGRSHAVRVVLG